MRGPKWQVYQDARGEWRWRLVADNGRIIAQGESHKRKTDAWRAIRTVQSAAVVAK